MIHLKVMDENEVKLVLSWNKEPKEFLKQWSNYAYPLTEDQIIFRIRANGVYVYLIEKDKEPLGTIQLSRFNKEVNSAQIGGFLISDEHRGKGFGTEALHQMIDVAFHQFKLDILGLSVNEFNKDAQRCYEKCGFIKTGETIRPNGWVVYQMELKKDSIS